MGLDIMADMQMTLSGDHTRLGPQEDKSKLAPPPKEFMSAQEVALHGGIIPKGSLGGQQIGTRSPVIQINHID